MPNGQECSDKSDCGLTETRRQIGQLCRRAQRDLTHTFRQQQQTLSGIGLCPCLHNRIDAVPSSGDTTTMVNRAIEKQGTPVFPIISAPEPQKQSHAEAVIARGASPPLSPSAFFNGKSDTDPYTRHNHRTEHVYESDVDRSFVACCPDGDDEAVAGDLSITPLTHRSTRSASGTTSAVSTPQKKQTDNYERLSAAVSAIDIENNINADIDTENGSVASSVTPTTTSTCDCDDGEADAYATSEDELNSFPAVEPINQAAPTDITDDEISVTPSACYSRSRSLASLNIEEDVDRQELTLEINHCEEHLTQFAEDEPTIDLGTPERQPKLSPHIEENATNVSIDPDTVPDRTTPAISIVDEHDGDNPDIPDIVVVPAKRSPPQPHKANRPAVLRRKQRNIIPTKPSISSLAPPASAKSASNTAINVSTSTTLYPASLTALDRPREALLHAQQQLDAPLGRWEDTVAGLRTFVRLLRHHPEQLVIGGGTTTTTPLSTARSTTTHHHQQHIGTSTSSSSLASSTSVLHTISVALARHVRNLRSQVSRAACQASAELFGCRLRAVRQQLDAAGDSDELAVALLNRTADTNRFLRADAQLALDGLCDRGGAARVFSVLIGRGVVHANAVVRTSAARLCARTVRRIGADKVMAGTTAGGGLSRDTRDRIVAAAAALLQEGSLETRQQAKDIFAVLAKHATFERVLTEAVPAKVMRNISKQLKAIQ